MKCGLSTSSASAVRIWLTEKLTVLEINERGFSPKATLDFFASDNRSRALRQEQEETEWLWLKFYEDTGFAELTRGRI